MLNNLDRAKTMLTESKTEEYNFPKFDIDSDKEFAMNELGIRSVPTIKFYKNGQEFHSKVGVMSPSEVVGLLT